LFLILKSFVSTGPVSGSEFFEQYVMCVLTTFCVCLRRSITTKFYSFKVMANLQMVSQTSSMLQRVQEITNQQIHQSSLNYQTQTSSWRTLKNIQMQSLDVNLLDNLMYRLIISVLFKLSLFVFWKPVILCLNVNLWMSVKVKLNIIQTDIYNNSNKFDYLFNYIKL